MLFNLVMPFVEVILHTYIDLLRDEKEDEAQKTSSSSVNDNSKEVVKKKNTKLFVVSPGEKELVSVDEKQQQKAMESYYSK